MLIFRYRRRLFMIGIRQKLMIGFGGLVVLVAVIGFLTMAQIKDLGEAIDIIMKENYRSVIACQDMKESLERIDSGILFTLSGEENEGNKLISEYTTVFQNALDAEMNNITIHGEGELAQQIKNLFERYTKIIHLVTKSKETVQERQSYYFKILQPLFVKIKETAQAILAMNQNNMSNANDQARHRANTAYQNMFLVILISAIMAILYSYLTHKWVLRPIKRLIESANDIGAGNLEIVLEEGAKDEIGRLSKTFNKMVSALRQVRDVDRKNLLRTRRATEEVFKSLPTAIAILDLDGKVEVSTEIAIKQFKLKPGVIAAEQGFEWLKPMLKEALNKNRIIEGDINRGYIQRFIENQEYFFQPMVIPILTDVGKDEPAGFAVILKDMTQLHEQMELKRGVVSTVSHQLKTPLTSLRMSVYLLLEEKIGSLNEKQVELLLAARDDSNRLVSILNDLLDLNRIESGKSNLSIKPVSPRIFVLEAIEPIHIDTRDRGITFQNRVSDELPDVMADSQKILHVFSNLFSNALRFTSPGGSITLGAVQEQDHVKFYVKDTGSGISYEHIDHIFEPFYRVPGQDEKTGIGLGLAIVKEIIRAHGGEVGVESEPGKGSTFYFTIPVAH
jgi:two-component system, NtrC family, sensor histidine kinase KinB